MPPSSAPPASSGTVFEDFNYGGGAGRDRVSAAGSNRPGARVELYDAGGGFVSFTATDLAGGLRLRRPRPPAATPSAS